MNKTYSQNRIQSVCVEKVPEGRLPVSAHICKHGPDKNSRQNTAHPWKTVVCVGLCFCRSTPAVHSQWSRCVPHRDSRKGCCWPGTERGRSERDSRMRWCRRPPASSSPSAAPPPVSRHPGAEWPAGAAQTYRSMFTNSSPGPMAEH